MGVVAKVLFPSLACKHPRYSSLSMTNSEMCTLPRERETFEPHDVDVDMYIHLDPLKFWDTAKVPRSHEKKKSLEPPSPGPSTLGRPNVFLAQRKKCFGARSVTLILNVFLFKAWISFVAPDQRWRDLLLGRAQDEDKQGQKKRATEKALEWRELPCHFFCFPFCCSLQEDGHTILY